MLVLSACGGGGGQAKGGAGETITIKLATPTAGSHHWSKNALLPWQKLVEEKTNGRVKVQLYEGGTLGTFNSVLTDLQGGLYDVGMVVPSYFMNSKMYPLSILTLAFAYPDPATGGKIGAEFFQKNADKVKIDGVRNLGVAVSDSYVFFSTKPIKTLTDIKGMKIRAQGAADAEIVKAWGGVPVNVPVQESYEALQKGVVEVSPYSSVGALGLKIHEVAPYLLDTKAWGTVTVPAMSEKFHASLPDDLKKVFDQELGPKLAELMQQSYIKEEDAARQQLPELLKKNGGDWLSVSSADLAQFKAGSQSQWDVWIKDANSKGYDGQGLVRSYLELMSAAGAEPPVKG
ncbi:TRAP transporter substrate-binding protein DctP [Streptosporangium sp. NBC_01755]|uniref:TRAP transporter substrate-binding protein n=1 Tax=Streptosporangium sp. NBC_01755 TaxID=2975949 RepID=UPI002DD86B75|nr:TRAP transporter substrate-binding protein DctP [Streptosporangium sp. NBC_01755]WSD04134.1 TRAP transporter substrate-binding protein DctP [Streptosporangium sp. NBC_01755]